MGLINYSVIASLVFLSMVFTGPVAAVSETRAEQDSAYERVEHQFVLSTRNEVMAFCDAGDTLTKGECAGTAESIIPRQHRHLYDQAHPDLEHVVQFESKEVTERGKIGWSCRATIVKADQELKITAAAKCKKAGEKAFKIKTPRIRGA